MRHTSKRPTKPLPDDTLTLTVSEAARHLRRSRAWAYAAAVDGRLPVVQTIAGLRVRTADLLAMIGVSPTIAETKRETPDNYPPK